MEKNKKYLNLFLNILFFLLSIVLFGLSLSVIVLNNNLVLTNNIFISFCVFFAINLINLGAIETINFINNKKIELKKIILLSILLTSKLIFLILICVMCSTKQFNTGFLWSTTIFLFIDLVNNLLEFVYWKFKIWDEVKNTENIINQ